MLSEIEALEKFKVEICKRYQEVDPEEREDWYSLSIGYFLAHGLPIEVCHKLACQARYEHQYWVDENEVTDEKG